MEGATPLATSEAAANLNLAQLAMHCGHSVRSLRAYLQIGVLQAGTRVGREARFDQTHIDRLEEVGEYRSRGYTLASIADLLEAQDTADTPRGDAQYDLDIPHARALVESWIDEPISYPTVGLLERSFPDVTQFPQLVEAAIGHGIASLEGTELVIHQPEVLRLGIDLLKNGVPIDVIADVFTRLRDLLEPLIEQAGDTFQALGYEGAGGSGEGRAYLLPHYLMTIGSILVKRIFEESQPEDIDPDIIHLD